MSGNRIMDGITEGQNNGRTEGQKDRTTEGQGESSIAPLFQSGAITMVMVLKMLYNRSAHLSVCTVQLFTRKCVYGDMVIV